MSLPAAIRPLLKGFPVLSRSLVRWGDLDAFSHVNNCTILQYHEDARIALCERIMAAHPSLQSFLDGKPGTVGPVLSRVDAKFIRQIRFPDSIYAGVRATDIEADRCVFETVLVSAEQEAVVGVAANHIAIVDFSTNRRAQLSPELLEVLHAHE